MNDFHYCCYNKHMHTHVLFTAICSLKAVLGHRCSLGTEMQLHCDCIGDTRSICMDLLVVQPRKSKIAVLFSSLFFQDGAGFFELPTG